jgi:hypothetical protein
MVPEPGLVARETWVGATPVHAANNMTDAWEFTTRCGASLRYNRTPGQNIWAGTGQRELPGAL